MEAPERQVPPPEPNEENPQIAGPQACREDAQVASKALARKAAQAGHAEAVELAAEGLRLTRRPHEDAAEAAVLCLELRKQVWDLMDDTSLSPKFRKTLKTLRGRLHTYATTLLPGVPCLSREDADWLIGQWRQDSESVRRLLVEPSSAVLWMAMRAAQELARSAEAALCSDLADLAQEALAVIGRYRPTQAWALEALGVRERVWEAAEQEAVVHFLEASTPTYEPLTMLRRRLHNAIEAAAPEWQGIHVRAVGQAILARQVAA